MSCDEWKEFKMGELCEITSSKRIFANDYRENGVLFYRGKEIIQKASDVPISEPLFIEREKFDEIKRKFGVPQKNDILLTSVGTLGVPYIVKEDEEFYFKDGNLTWFRNFNSNVDSKFIYQWLRSRIAKEQIDAITIGSTQQALTIVQLKKINVRIPGIVEQKSIAATISALDDKIELNNRINKTLEGMVQAIFKQWFVDFEFPDENGHPYKSSGGEMEESELGLIPKGWKVIRLSDICHVLSGGTPKTGVAEYWNGVIPFFSPKDAIGCFYTLHTEKTITDEGLKKCNSKLYPKDTVFITARGTVGKVVLSGRDMAMNQSCYALQGRDGVGQYFLFFQTLRAVDQLKKSASGAVFDAIVVKSFASIKVVMPPSCIVGNFCDLVSSLFSNIFINTEQSNALVSLRDALLPKLMSGEIRVPIEEVAADV